MLSVSWKTAVAVGAVMYIAAFSPLELFVLARRGGVNRSALRLWAPVAQARLPYSLSFTILATTLDSSASSSIAARALGALAPSASEPGALS